MKFINKKYLKKAIECFQNNDYIISLFNFYIFSTCKITKIKYINIKLKNKFICMVILKFFFQILLKDDNNLQGY